MELDAHLLVAALHHRALVRLSAFTGRKLCGLGAATKGYAFSSNWKRKLREMDAVLGLVEKISMHSCEVWMDDLERELDVSLLVASHDVVQGSMASTNYLASFFDRNPVTRVPIRDLLQELRSFGVLNAHGHGEQVGQLLKTASVAILCTGLVSSLSQPHAPSLRRYLLHALATFDADAWYFEYWWVGPTERSAFGIEKKARGSRSLASGKPLLVVRRGGHNSASHLTQPQWARFQWACWELLDCGSPLFNDVKLCAGVREVDCDFSSEVVRHYRARVSSHAWWNLPGDDFAVMTIWPRQEGSGVLFVLAGSGNEIAYDVAGYRQIIVFTWCHDWTSNPRWLPHWLLSVAQCVSRVPQEPKPDVLAISRGVQAMMCSLDASCYGLSVGSPTQMFETLGRVVLAGGCLFQRTEQDFQARAMAGLEQASSSVRQRLFTLSIVSEVHGSCLKRGSYSRKSRRGAGHRVDYADFSKQIDCFVAVNRVLGFADHSQVCVEGVRAMACIKQGGCVPDRKPDIVASDLDLALLEAS